MISQTVRSVSLLVLFAGLAPSPLLAHTLHSAEPDFWHGFLHAFHGPDHVVAFLAVGVLASRCNGITVGLIPLTFTLLAAAGWLLPSAGVGLPHTETGIVLSVIALGLLLGLNVRIPFAAVLAVVGSFGFLHGSVHAAEVPGGAIAPGLGLVLATGLLQVLGILTGFLLLRLLERRAIRAVGFCIAVLGVLPLV